MARAATLAAIAVLVAGCASDPAQDSESVAAKPAMSEEPAASEPPAAPRELKREARQLVTQFVVNDMGGTSVSVICPRVYEGYVACSATWRTAMLRGRARCQGDFDLDLSNRPLKLPAATTSFCIESSG